MKFILIYGLIILLILLISCGKQSPPILNTTSNSNSEKDKTSEIYMIEGEESVKPQPQSTFEISVSETNGETMTQVTDESIEPVEYFYPFAENGWIKKFVESIRENIEFENKNDKKNINVSQLNGKLVYTTDFNRDIIIYKHPQNNFTFTGESFGNQFGMGCITIIGDGFEAYSIYANRILDIFAYGDHVYYIWLGEHGFFGGIKNLTYNNKKWIDDIEFNSNEISKIFYFGKPKYTQLLKACVFEDEAYIITAAHIYLFDGIELTPVFNRTIGWGTCSVTRIGDSFYIGGEGYIAECNIVTGEEYIWVKTENNEE